MTEWIISSSALICAVLVLRRLLKGKVNPRLQYALWAIVLVRLILPVSFFSSSLSIQNVQQEVMDRPEVRQMYAAMNAPIVSDREDLPADPQTPAEAPRLPAEQPGQEASAMPEPEQEVPAMPETGQEAPAQTISEQTGTMSVQDVLRQIWIGGMAVLAVWMTGCNAHFAVRLRRSRRALCIEESPVEVYITNAIETPCLFGLLRPAVYLTSDAAEDEQVRKYVLTHELTHYRQLDHVWSVLRGVALVIHWYNPLVWAAFRASRQDGEMACDEGTLKQLGEEHRGSYGRTLIALATRTRLRGTLVTATTMADGKKAIKERIVILMKNPKTALVTMICLILCCVLVVGCTFTGSVEDSEPTEPVETTQPAETTEPVETTVPVETEPVDPYADYYELLRYLNSSNMRNWLNIALGCEFDDPTEVDLEKFFHVGTEKSHYWEFMDEAEQRFLIENGLGGGYYAILPESELESIAQSTFGLSLADFSCGIPESWVYYQGNKSYYFQYVSGGKDQYTIQDFTIDQVETLEDGLVRVYYTPNDNTHYLNGQRMTVTLRAVGDGEYMVVSNHQVTDEQNYTTLTLEQIDEVNEAFETMRYWEEDGLTMGGSYAIANCFTSYYSDPSELDFYDFMRYFSAYGVVNEYDSDTSEEEFYWLINQESWPFGNDFEYENRVWQQVPIHKTPAWVVEKVLQYYYGIGLGDLKDVSGVLYSEKYDAYYSFASDFGPGSFYCVGGRIYDGYVELYSSSAILTLREENGKYYMVSHIPMSWLNPTELTQAQITQVNNAFQSTVTIADGSVAASPVSCFFTSYYESPEQIDLVAFMRYFSAYGIPYYSHEKEEYCSWTGAATPTEAEFQALREKELFAFKGAESLADMPVPLHKYDADAVDAVLVKYACVRLSNLNDAGKDQSGLYYLEEYDAYYNHTSDFGPGMFECIGGLDYGTYVELYSDDAVLTLRKAGWDDYYIDSYLPR